MSSILRLGWLIPVVTLALAAGSSDAHAQLGKLKQKMKQKADQTTDKAIDQGINQADPTAPKSGAAPAADTGAAGTPTGAAAASEPGASGSTASAAAAAPPAEWANYDFVPGSRVIFDTDFSEDKVGNFPQRLEYKSGQLEVVEFGGVRMLKASDRSDLIVPLAEPLPARYTVEIDFLSQNGNWGAFSLAGGRAKADEFTRVDIGDQGIEIHSGGATVVNAWYSEAQKKALKGQLVHARFLGDDKYLKVYANEKRLANIPNSNVKRENALYLALWGADGGDRPVYISRIRVAESQQTVYDALSSAGRWTTQGILFETGKSDLKPESTPTLKEIAGALKDHPDLKVEVQGHTDNVGRPADNQALSDARAAAVKSALVGQYGVNAAQLTTKGYGDTKPVADNKTAEGRQNNRRVDLVKS